MALYAEYAIMMEVWRREAFEKTLNDRRMGSVLLISL